MIWVLFVTIIAVARAGTGFGRRKLAAVTVPLPVKNIGTGSRRAFLVLTDGTAYSTGEVNTYVSYFPDQQTFTKIDGVEGVEDMEAGAYGVMMLKTDGTVFGTG